MRIASATFEAGATTLAALPPEGAVEIAFGGRSNVGKSSLMNALVQRTGLVRTSRTPGCTRALNLFDVGLGDGTHYRLVDLPGYGYAKLSKAEKAKWGKLIESYLESRRALRVLVVLVDIRRGIEPDDTQLVDYVATCRKEGDPPLECVIVATKLDKLPLSRRKPALAALKKASGVSAIGFSAVTGEGRELLWTKLRAAAQA